MSEHKKVTYIKKSLSGKLNYCIEVQKAKKIAEIDNKKTAFLFLTSGIYDAFSSFRMDKHRIN